VRVPAVEGERADARPLGRCQEFRGRACRLGEVGAHLGNAANLDRRTLLARFAVERAGTCDRRDPDAILEHARKGRIAVAIKLEKPQRRLVANGG
jgi:hypothetical protein